MGQPAALHTSSLLYDGKLGGLYKIFLINLLWTLLTLGIFHFRAITRTRRHLWSHMSLQGKRFEYTGAGGELFVGVMLALLTLTGVVVAAVLLIALSVFHPLLGALMIGLLCGGVSAVAAGVVFSAQRYRLSRTLWAGLRSGTTGSAPGYGVRSLGYGLLVIVTLF